MLLNTMGPTVGVTSGTAGVTALDAELALEVPLALVAVTVNV